MERKLTLYPAAVNTIYGQKWGFINSKGIFIIKPQFEYAYDFQENGLAIVGENGKYGVINKSGHFVVNPKYDTINPFANGRAVVIDEEGFKVINRRGDVITSKAYRFIGMYQNDRALYSETNEEGEYVYGYLDRHGKEVIPAKYMTAYDFNEGRAVVQLAENKYALIAVNGDIFYTYPYETVGKYSEGLLAFQLGDKYGYMNERGQVVIEPQFASAQPFQDGRAVVSLAKDDEYHYGLIDINGNYVISPQYDDIQLLGERRAAVGKAVNEEQPYMGLIYAIANLRGNLLSDFSYFDVLNYENGFASANDGKNTFFLNKKGNIEKSLPIIKGSGTLHFEGDLIKAMIDLKTFYVDRKGNIVWKPNSVIPLNNWYRVVKVKYKPNKDYLVYYPRIIGMEDAAAQERVNERLKDLAQVKKVPSDVQLESSYTGDFAIEFFQKDLLVIEINGYDFPFGAAHGMPYRVYPHIDLQTGAFYELKDLFKENSNYVKVLSDIIGEQIENDEQYSYVFPDSYKGIQPDQPFYISEDALNIYFEPYEIAPYAAGFPTFHIPFTEISTIINKEGEFWNSFY